MEGLTKVTIPPHVIKQIKCFVEKKDVEYGGFMLFESDRTFKSMEQFHGEELFVNVPTANYEVHWHTHIAKLIKDNENLNQTGLIQPPSINDIAQSSAKYFSQDFLSGGIIRQIVFTQDAIYIQYPIPGILDKLFKTKDLTFKPGSKTEKIWTNKWYNPFRRKAKGIVNKIKDNSMDAENYHDFRVEGINEALKLEREYFALCQQFGVLVQKMSWKDIKKEGIML